MLDNGGWSIHLTGMIEIPRFAVAPMMDRTDRHCRYLHRLLTRRTLLFSEMITADAVIHGERQRLLAFDPSEHPLALQLGGAEPRLLAEAARLGVDFGYDEINLNAGCPSDRVQSGAFGACLMRRPQLVADCVVAIRNAVNVPVTVKCRLGVDDQDTESALDVFADQVIEAGVSGLWVHARKAWLQGISPKENRTVPPLDHDRVVRLKQRFPETFIGLNGGIADIGSCEHALQDVDGVMVGRAAYDNPGMLTGVDRALFGVDEEAAGEAEAAAQMAHYIDREREHGVPAHRITRHMLGLFVGTPGARAWRRTLTRLAVEPGAGGWIIGRALDARAEAARAPRASLAA